MWRYLVGTFTGWSANDIERRMNDLSSHGWQLVSSGGDRAVYKRLVAAVLTPADSAARRKGRDDAAMAAAESLLPKPEKMQ
jgi:hypothetical protein